MRQILQADPAAHGHVAVPVVHRSSFDDRPALRRRHRPGILAYARTTITIVEASIDRKIWATIEVIK